MTASTGRLPAMRKLTAITLAAGVLALTATACGGDSDKDKKSDAKSAAPTSATASSEGSSSGGMKPFGAACSKVPESGSGSFSGMAQDPVATAASHNPLLSTLVTAVKKADLVDTLNSQKAITVFAPTNDAFAKIPKADLDKVLADKAKLTKILTTHVIGERLSPGKLAGTHKSLESSNVKVTGSGEDFTVNGNAKVLCGSVQTSNATVYIIDTVLMPTS